MKWSNFRRVLQDNPDIASWLPQHIGPPMLVSAPLNVSLGVAGRMLRKYVRDKLTYIAIRSPRDFDKLDLSSGSSRRDKPVFAAEDVSCFGPTRIRTDANYSVRFHIVGYEESGARLVYVDSRDYRGECEPCLSVEAVIESRKAWHQLYWAKLGHALCFDAVVIRTLTLVVDDRGEELSSTSLDIFRFPESYTFPGLDLPRPGMM
jgi:hypothetical protein